MFPGPSGGHNWHPMAFSPKTRLDVHPGREMALTYPMKAGFKHDASGVEHRSRLRDYLEIIGGRREPAPVGQADRLGPGAGQGGVDGRAKGAFNGGILATAGNLVFQGRPDGVLVAYAADTGKVLWETETSIGIIAPPITYTVGDDQYVAVLAGWGGNTIVGMDAAVAIATTHVNMGRMLAWKLGGHATMPPVPQKSLDIPEPPPLTASAEAIDHGRQLYNEVCSLCHGLLAVSSGVVTDLRFASAETHASWDEIVRGGSLSRHRHGELPRSAVEGGLRGDPRLRHLARDRGSLGQGDHRQRHAVMSGAAPPMERPYTKGLHELGNGLYAWLQPDGGWGWSNAGLVVDGDRSLLVDTLFDLKLTREMLAAMRARHAAAARIDTLVNTHANGDHCYGNQLVAGARIIASARERARDGRAAARRASRG